jgi:ketosteroid isomerase-like protein
MQVDAWNAGNVEGYMTGYWQSDSTTFVSGGSRFNSYDSLQARYKRSYPTPEAMGQLSFEELEIVFLSPSAAIARGIWRLRRQDDEPWGRFTLLVDRKEQGWRIVYDHTSSATAQ